MLNYKKEENGSSDAGNKSEEKKEKECGQPHLYQGQGESNEVFNHNKEGNDSGVIVEKKQRR